MRRNWKYPAGFLMAIVICLFTGIYTVSAFTGVKYPYEESNQERVAVTVTISSDGVPVLGKDGTPVSHVEVEVPYFDLRKYGLEEFYRYPTDAECNYVGSTVIKRPTVLHLLIYMAERCYLGLPESQCGQGTTVSALSEPQYERILNLFGEEAYSTIEADTANGRSILKYSGKPKSFYMTNFWGHDENLNYYVNHKYPVIWTDWGASSDYILLKDGDIVDLAMFTDWGFYKHGGFAFFRENEYRITTGSTLKVKTYMQGTGVTDETGSSFTTPAPAVTTNLVNAVYNSDWQQIQTNVPYDSQDWISYTFDTPGVYYLVSSEAAAGGANASKAPATAKVIVTDAGKNKVESVTVKGQYDRTDIMCGSTLQMEAEVLPENASDRGVLWEVSGDYAGIDRNTGLLKPVDYLDSEKTVVVRAYSRADNSVEGSAEITVKPNPADVEKVKNVESLISAIGSSVDEVVYTPECKAKLEAASAALAELEDDTKLAAHVSKSKLDFLAKAKEKYALLEAAAAPTPEPSQTPSPLPSPTPTPKPQITVKPTAAPTAAPTQAPESIRQMKAYADKITIKWTKDKAAKAGYRIYIKGGAFKSYKKVAELSAKKTSYTISKVNGKKLSAGQSYTIKVVSLRKKGAKKTEGKQQILKNASTLPGQPAFSYAKKAKSGAVKLKWKKVTGAQGFEIQMSTKAKSQYKTIKTTSDKVKSFTKKNLKKGKTYYFRIRSFRKNGNIVYYSSWSKTRKVKA